MDLDFNPVGSHCEKRVHPEWVTLGGDGPEPTVHVRAENIFDQKDVQGQLDRLYVYKESRSVRLRTVT